MMARLITDQDGRQYSTETNVEDSPEGLKGLLNETRWAILTALAEEPSYPAELAEKLDLHEQKVYYHIREMRDHGIIKIASREERSGSVAKYYQPTAHAYTLRLPGGDRQLADLPVQEDTPARRFLGQFIAGGTIDGRIVVGSPDPHGPHQVRGRDGHFAVDIAALLGRHGTIEGELSRLDTDINNETAYKDNLFLVGGPLTNIITAEFNDYLPVHFDQQNFPYRRLTSEQTGDEYSEGTIGLIAKIPNPEATEKTAIVVAGIRNTGTRAAVLGLTQYADDIIEDYEGEDTWARVVRGRDMDGDGRIDAVETVE